MGVKVGGKKWVQLSLSEYPHFFDSPEIPGDAIVGLFLFGDFISTETKEESTIKRYLEIRKPKLQYKHPALSIYKYKNNQIKKIVLFNISGEKGIAKNEMI